MTERDRSSDPGRALKLLPLRYVLLLVSLFAVPGVAGVAKSGHPSGAREELYRTIAALDSALFDAYNRCDLEKFAGFFAKDVEFYHDEGGLLRSRRKLVESVKKNICGKVRRELVTGTLEVYPIAGYGAIETGVHRFYELANGEGSKPSGEAKFLHVWQKKGGAWVITRVVSYAHSPLGE
jgi:hypothetical protein